MNQLPRIFIGSSRESLEIAKGIKANFEFDKVEVRIWNEDLFDPGQYTLDELIRFTKSFDFGIFVWAADDKVESRDNIKSQPRDNVILEAGMFYGTLGKERVFLFAPIENESKIPSDLLGLSTLRYNTPSDGNFRAALSLGVDKIKKIILAKGQLKRSNENSIPIKIYKNLELAKNDIVTNCLKSIEIKILSNKGLEFFGSDSSIISLAEINKYTQLKRLKILLLSPFSRWINRGFMALRNYETIEDFQNELISTHNILESGIKKFLKLRPLEKSGIKYHKGEPFFRLIMTDNSVFVSTYAETPTTQVRELPVYEFKNDFGSLYGSLRKHFNDLWHNNSDYSETFKEIIDIEISAGGIVYCSINEKIFIALIQRDDGSWVLPKGHKKIRDIDLVQTALREISEETGILKENLNCIKDIGSYSYDETAEIFGVSKLNHFFLINCNSETLPKLNTDLEHTSAKWWAITEELPFLFYSYQKILLSETLKNEFKVDAKINPK